MASDGVDLEHRIQSFLDLVPAHPGVALEARSDLATIIKDLDLAFWDKVDEAICSVFEKSTDFRSLSYEARALLDVGLLDPRLVATPARDLRAALEREFAERGKPNYRYLSEWLPEALRLYTSISKPTAAEIPAQAPAELPPICAKLTEARLRIYGALKPFLENVPGASGVFVEPLRAGKLDSTIQGLCLLGTDLPQHLSDRLARLKVIRADLLGTARGQCSTDRQLALFDALRQVDERMEAEVARFTRTGDSPVAPVISAQALPPAERIQVATAEIKSIRSLIRLSTMGTGITRTHSVLLTDADRVTKDAVWKVLSQVRELDPHLPGNPAVLLLPACGKGLYAWDKDMVILPIIPIGTIEESLVAALASYRIMVDGVQKSGRLKREYEKMFPECDFRRDFGRDYRDWILGIGKGFRGAMDTPHYDFFKRHVGPNPNELFGPSGLVSLSPDERSETIRHCRRRVNRGESNYGDHYQLAVLYWRESHTAEALEQMEISVKLQSDNPRAVFALGFMYLRVKSEEKALKAFVDVARIAPNSLWHVYATELLGSKVR